MMNKKLDIISASEIERYGYCPLSWWLSKQGVDEHGEEHDKLEQGTKRHSELSKVIYQIKEREEFRKGAEINIAIFAVVAILLGINGMTIVYPRYISSELQLQVISNLLLIFAILWLIVASMFFLSLLRKPHLQHLTIKLKLSFKRPEYIKSDWKRTASLFIIVAIVLAGNGITLIIPLPPEILSRFLMLSALLWLIGTSLFLYLALKKSSSSPLSKSWTPEEWTIIVFAVVAMLLAINGLTVKQRVMIAMMDLIGRMLLGFAILWLLTGFIIFYISLKGGIISRGIERELNQLLTEATDKDAISINQKLQQLEQREQAEATRGTLWFAIVAIALALNSIMIRMGPHLLLGHIFEIIALVWLIGACFFLYDALKNSALAKKLRTIHKIIAGEIKYVDKLSAATPILITAKYGIRGRPDYIIEREGRYVPVEIKIGRIPKGPYFSHILQIAAYCLLVEEQYRTVPPYGVIKYTEDSKTKECKIEYTPELKSLLLEKISAMRVAIRTQDVHRNHRRIGKCKNCSRRLACKERLV